MGIGQSKNMMCYILLITTIKVEEKVDITIKCLRYKILYQDEQNTKKYINNINILYYIDFHMQSRKWFLRMVKHKISH